ncbi:MULTISPECIES: hypothetical protein [unclassified Streptomyces]|uniref:hypothetical protein n=1 Tax=unclassified Streptomyces TaxID=2593676 RepID=UPI0038294EAC
MRARTDTDVRDPGADEDRDADVAIDAATEDTEDTEDTGDAEDGDAYDDHDHHDHDHDHGDDDHDDSARAARRARWAATGTGALLTLAGFAASLLRLTGPAPVLVPAAYALGAAVCALAAFLGSRGRTRRALWLLIAGVMVMAVGDQSD